MARLRSLLLCLALASITCGPGTPRPRSAPSDPAPEPDPARAETGTFAIDTGRAHVVRLGVVETGPGQGRLRISSALAGVFVRVDGAERLPLPVELDLASGAHVIVAICPDGGEETSRVSVVPDEAMDVQVCSQPRPR